MKKMARIIDDEYTDEYLNHLSLQRSMLRYGVNKPPRTSEVPVMARFSRCKYRDANYMP